MLTSVHISPVQSILEAQARLEQGEAPLDDDEELDPFIEEQLKYASPLLIRHCAHLLTNSRSERNRQQHLMNKYQIEEIREALVSGIGLSFEGIFVRSDSWTF